MPATVTVVYPTGAKFDLDYYMAKHMPLVQSKWGSYGLTGWKVVKYGDDSPYCIGATLDWNSKADFQKAAEGPEAGEVLGDIKNFSDKDPVIMAGEDVGTS